MGFSGIMGNNLGGLFCCFFHFCEGGGGVRFLGVRYLGSGWGSVSGVTASRGSKGVLQSDLPLKCDMSTSSSVLLEVSGQECGLSLCYVTVWPVMIYFIGRKYSLEITALFQLFVILSKTVIFSFLVKPDLGIVIGVMTRYKEWCLIQFKRNK